MNSASKVGEIFTKAGESFHKIADMTMLLEPNTKVVKSTGAKKQVILDSIFVLLKRKRNRDNIIVQEKNCPRVCIF